MKALEAESLAGIPPGPRLGDKVIEAKDLKKGFGDQLLVENMSFNLPRGGIVGIIGPNGAGKSTLFRMLVGEEQPDSGIIICTMAIPLADSINNEVYHTQFLNAKGLAYEYKNKARIALKNYLEALEKAEKTNEKLLLAFMKYFRCWQNKVKLMVCQ